MDSGDSPTTGDDALNPPEIDAAIRALQTGAPSRVFDSIYELYQPPILQFFRNRTDLREDAEELAQETMLLAYERLESYRFEGPFGGWIWRIAKNTWKNAVRDRSAMSRAARLETLAPSAADIAIVDMPGAPVFPEPPSEPEELATRREERQLVWSAVDQLPTGMRTVIELHYGADLTYAEIAAILGRSVGTIGSQIHDGKRRLAELVRGVGRPPDP